jgi:VanZ family protein
MTMMAKLTRVAWLWGPPLVLMAVIFLFSSMSNDDTHRTVLKFLIRKAAHLSEYALLLALWWRALRTRIDWPGSVRLALGICVSYAITDELHQRFIDGRVSTWHDVLIDAAGASLAAALIVRRRRGRREPVAA